MSEQNVIHVNFGNETGDADSEASELINIAEHPDWREAPLFGEPYDPKKDVPAVYHVPGIDPEVALHSLGSGFRRVISRMSGRD